MSNDKLNWATIAPESRIYKGKNLYRWDVSPGLEHHCGVCATPLHNSRAKTTCLGKHVEPCYRFHQQLHFVGKSHECFGCNSSDEMHHNRHKEILKIVRQINAIDQGNASPLILSDRKRQENTAQSTPTDTSSETYTIDGGKLTRRERKRLKKVGNGTPKDKGILEIFPIEELDFISEAIHLKKHESKGAWAGTYNYGDVGEEIMIADEVNETGEKNQAIMPVANDSSAKPFALLTTRQRKTIKKYSTQVGQASYRGGSRKFSSGSSSDIFDGVDPQIFFRLGVELTKLSQNTKAHRDLATKLVAAIKEDLEIIEREEAESAMRREGFWRWAGKTAHTYIARVREDFDWATGQKIEKVEAHNILIDESDGDEFENDAVDTTTAVAVPPKELNCKPEMSSLPAAIEPKIFEKLSLVLTPKSQNKVNMSKSNKSVSWLESPSLKPTPSTPVTKSPAWTEFNPLRFDTPTPNPVPRIKQVTNEDDDEGWETVKPSRSRLFSTRRNVTKSAEPRSAYRKLGEANTLYLK